MSPIGRGEAKARCQARAISAIAAEQEELEVKKILLALITVVAIGVAVPVALAAPSAPSITLKPVAGNYPPPAFDKATGNGKYSQAQWTNKQAHTGSKSILLQKSVDYFSCYSATPENGCASFAGVVVKGVEGLNANNHPIGYSFKGESLGGSPRVNLYYDNDGDGEWDGYKFLADSTTAGAPDASGWRTVTDNTSLGVTVGDAMLPAATIIQLSLIIDNKQTTHVDDVVFDTTTVGEPGN
jgi:hypothetical protein